MPDKKKTSSSANNMMKRRKVKIVDMFTGLESFQALACMVGERGSEWENLEDLQAGQEEYWVLRLLASVRERPVAGVRE